MMKKKAVIGFLLIILGLVFLLKPHIELTGPVFLCGLGALFFIGYLLFQAYGLLIPGGILLGLGAGFLAKSHSGEETGKILGITRERVRQIQERALVKLKQLRVSSELEAFIQG